VGFLLFADGGIIVVFSNNGAIITDSLTIILGADRLMAGLLTLKVVGGLEFRRQLWQP
jgi:hypothetical protein